MHMYAYMYMYMQLHASYASINIADTMISYSTYIGRKQRHVTLQYKSYMCMYVNLGGWSNLARLCYSGATQAWTL